MSEEDTKTRGLLTEQHDPGQPPPPPPPSQADAQYGTFQGVPIYPPPLPPHHHQQQEPVIGFPHPAPPPGAFPPSSHGYQAVPGFPIEERRPLRERRLPCCGIGIGWFLFIIGFFLAGIPWYIGAIMLICSRNLDLREKPGYIGCTIAAILEIIAIIVGVTKGTHH